MIVIFTSMLLSRNSFQIIRLLVERDLSLRYRKSLFGVAWTLLNPMMTSLVLWTVFNYLFAARFISPSSFATYLILGVLFISFWNQGVLMSAESIAGNTSILTKIRVRPVLFAVSNSITAYINFIIGFIPLLVICLITDQAIRLTIIFVPIIGLLFIFFITGVGLCLSFLFIRFEDTRNIANVLLLILGYLTPVFYPISALSPTMQSLIGLNPLNAFLEGLRWSALGLSNPNIGDWIAIIILPLFVYTIGERLFLRNWPKIVSML